MKMFNHNQGGKDQFMPTVKFHFDNKSGEMVEHLKTAPFLKGPIPISWLSRAAALPGKAINVALTIRWLEGMSGGKPFKLSKKVLGLFYVSVDAALDALRRMEVAGLIKLTKTPGQRHLIEVLLDK